MAIDMIEQSDFGNFTEGKLGLKSFADEDICANLNGSENFGRRGDLEEYFNLFGSKMRKESIANVKREQDAKWASRPTKTCDDLRRNIAEVEIDIDTLTKMSATQTDFWIAPALEKAREWKGTFTKMRNSMDCDLLEAKAKEEAAKKETLEKLQQISDTTVSKTKEDILGIGVTQNQTEGEKILGVDKKIVTYAGLGVGALLIFVLILRK